MNTTLLTLLFVNVLGLGAMAAIGGAVWLAVFLLVGMAALRLRRTIGAHARVALPFLAAALDPGWKQRRHAPAVTSPPRASVTPPRVCT
jgi:hypothetical protein